MKKKCITGSEILQRWGVAEFELLNAVKKGLPVHDAATGERFVYGTISFKLRFDVDYDRINRKPVYPLFGRCPFRQLCMYLVRSIYLIQDVEDYEKQNFMTPASTTVKEKEQEQAAHVDVKPEKQKPFSIDVSEGTTWADIHVRIVNDQRIEITHPGGMAPWTMKDLGFESKPKLKQLFELFATKRGNVRIPEITKKKENIRRLKEHINSLFPNIKGQSIKYYQQKYGYACAFYIKMADTSTDDEKAWESQSEWRQREAELKDVMGAKIVYDPAGDLDEDKYR